MTQKTDKKKDEIDTGVYEVESIVTSKLIGRELLYTVKWKGYTESDDSDEPELRLTCNSKLIAYLVSQLDTANYTKSIDKTLKHLRLYKKDTNILKIIDPLAFIAATTCFAGVCKFVNNDAINMKYLFLEYVRDYDQSFLLHSALLPSRDILEDSEDRYADELCSRREVSGDYPLVRISFPTHYDTVLYPPPPQCNLIFEPVTAKMAKERDENVFVTKSNDPGFNDVQVFLEENDSENDENDPDSHSSDSESEEALVPRTRAAFDRELRFRATLELVQEVARGWILRGSHNVEVDTPLIRMCGVIRPAAEAHKSLRHQGEQVAFSSFIEIPDTEKCLDRRQFYDFSKFIPHSCRPTCSVRLVESGTDIPDLVVFNIVPLSEANSREISIDYFQGFARDVRKYYLVNGFRNGKIFGLYNDRIDFVQCQCNLRTCRQVLYIDKSIRAKDTAVPKVEKMKDLEPLFRFSGMKVVESNRVWSIVNGKFEE